MLTRHHSQGTALLACVAMLLLLMGGVSVAALHFLLAGRHLTSQPLDREIAFRAAEAALRDAEADLLAAIAADAERIATWPAAGTCGLGAQRGLCAADGDRSAWRAWLDGTAPGDLGIPVGTYPGATLPALPDGVIGATVAPRYLIEIMDDPPASGMWPRMRIVALGLGRDPDVRVLLQTEFQP